MIISTLGDIQNLATHCAEQPAVADPALSRVVGLDGLQRSMTTPTVVCLHKATAALYMLKVPLGCIMTFVLAL